MRTSIRLAGIVLGLVCALSVRCAQAQEAPVTLHIPAEPLDQALVDFALQARLSIGHPGAGFGRTRGNAVDGTFVPAEGLRRLLAGTGYGFDFLEAGTVRIRLVAPNAPAPLRQAEQVVVTATKREAVAQKLPVSIVVTTGYQLQSTGTETPNELTTQVAGLLATNLGPGQDKLFVRGLSDSVLPGLSESMVGLYLDEARITDDAPDPDLRLVDIDRVEVVRGPQGTLYGAGSLGGLVRIITNKPDLDSQQISATSTDAITRGGAPSFGWDMMLNQPIVSDVLAVRAVAYWQHDGGYIDDLRLHVPDANATGTEGGRIALAWQPNAIWSVTAGFVYQDIREKDSQYYTNGTPPLTRDNAVREPQSNRFVEGSLTADAHFGWADFTSASALTIRGLHGQYDATQAWTALTGLPPGVATFDDGRGVTSVTQEFRLTSTSEGRWQWLAGAYYSHRDEDFHSDLTGPDASGAPLDAQSEHRLDHADELALFGEATFSPWPQFSITAGARVFNASHAVLADGFAAIPATNFTFDGAIAQNGVTPKLVLAYRPRPRIMVYASASEGYRLGGFNVDGPASVSGSSDDDGGKAFDSDVLWNYELGAKTTFWDGRIVLNAAGYLAVWRNVQTDQIAPDGTFFIVNAGTVNDLGVETDVSFVPVDNLTLQGNLFFNNAQLSHPNPLLVQTEGVLPGAPDISFGVSGRYDFPWRRWGDFFAGFDYSYVGRSHLGFDESNSPAMGGYHLTNVRLGFQRGRWQAVLFADNLANEQKNTFAFGNPFDFATTRQITPPRPRTVGISLGWSE